jgi:rhodanese-related sulfurtransferase
MGQGKTFRQRVHEAGEYVRFLLPAAAKAMIDRGNVKVIDVGEPWQIAERGSIPGAWNIPRGEIDIKADSELSRREPELQDRGQKIILTCGGGGKATLAAQILGEMGFTDVWVIKGGCKSWGEAGYELGPAQR